MAQLISENYATALFQLAAQEGIIEKAFGKINLLKNILEENSDFNKTIMHPEISHTDKFDIFKNALGDDTPETVLNFLGVILRKGRMADFSEIVIAFGKKIEQMNNILNAEVTSAMPLNEAQLSRIKAELEKKNNKKIKLEAVVDPSIIGGLKVRVGDNIVDTSVRSNIEDIRNSLYK